MGYSWTSIGTGSTIRITEFNEFKTNIDSLYGDLELDAPTWTYLPVVAKDVGVDSILKETRTKTDYADDQNYCRNDNATHDATIHVDENTGYNYGYETGVDEAYNNAEDTGENIGHDATYDGTVYNSHYPYADSDYDLSHDDTVESGDNINDDASVNDPYNGTFT